MVKNLFNKSFKRIIAVSILIIIILNIFSPYRAYASSYDDLRNLVEEIEKDPELASTFWTSMGTADLPRPDKDIYKDEYIDAMTKWIAVQFMPDIERNDNEVLKDAFLNSEPFLEENMPQSAIPEKYYSTGLNNVNKAYEEYNDTIESGGSKDDALNNSGDSLNQDITDKVERDVTAGQSGGADIWDGGNAEIGIGGILLNPIFDFVLFIGDAVNATLQSVMYSGEDQNGPLSTILSSVTGAFDIMSEDSSDQEFDSTSTSNTITVRIIQKYVKAEYPHIHYSCEEIFSGKVGILGIDFISGEGQTEGLANVRTVIASWYRTLRLLAIVGFLSVLIYTGIKIMISSTAEDKAKYKEWIINWFIGVAILFCMHYIMSFIITIVQMFNDGLNKSLQYINVHAYVEKFFMSNDVNVTFNTNLIGLVRFLAQSSVSIFKLGYLIIYIMLITFTVKFTFVYLKRVINMAFLTLIAPIVAFTYPLDKMSDGQAQGFNMWIKEYIFNALLQPMHFILYYVLVGSSIMIAAENPIYAIAVLAFMSEGERLLKKIFGFDKASGGTVKGMQDAFAAAAVATSLSSFLGRIGQGGKNQAQGKMPFPGAVNKDYQNGIDFAGSADSSGGVLPGSSGPGGSPNGGGSSAPGGGAPGSGGPGPGGNNGGPGGVPPVPPPNPPRQQTNNNGPEPIRNKASRIGKGIRGGAAALGKRAVRSIWDFDKSGKYNGKRLVRKLAKGAVGVGVGVTAAAVQAGISLTDGKYNPAEGVAAFAAGYGLAGRKIDDTVDTFESGYADGLTKDEKMEMYQEDFKDRDDVIQFCKENYGNDWREYRERMATNYVSRGFTDLKEMKEMMKYSDAISGDTSGLSAHQKEEMIRQNDISAMAIKNVQKRKLAEGSLRTPYNPEQENAYINAKTQGETDPAKIQRIAQQIRGEDAAIRYYNSIVKK